jgi:hypothetical protein
MNTNYSKYRIQGVTGSLVIHLLLLLILLFLGINLPNPPLSERGGGGIELNYGTDLEGMGETQAMEQLGTVNQNTIQPNQEIAQPSNETFDNKAPLVSENEEESIAINDSKLMQKSTSQNKEVEQKDKVDTKNNNTESSRNLSSINTKALMGANQGDKEGTIGYQGNAKGTLNAKALYGDFGKGGGSGGGEGGGVGTGRGDGASLDMAGWIWDFKPKVKDETNESGKIVFKIKINSEGEIVSVIPIEKSVSPELVKIYQDEVMKLTFTKTDNTASPPPYTEGKITFIIRSK